MRLKTLLNLFLLLVSVSGITQNLSNKGKEFWVGYGHHQFFETGTNSQEMLLYLSAEEAAIVTVSINGTSYSNTYSIPANTVIATPPIPKSGTNDARLFSGTPGFSGSASEGISSRGIHIVSSVPIVAYAHIYGSASSGSTMLMPVETYGYSYVSLNSQQRYGSNNCFSWMYVVANENNTRIEITPTVPTRGGRPANVPFTVTLNKGQIYQVLGALITSSNGYDLTGTKVKSIANSNGECFPVGVFSGSSRTYITCSGTGGSGGDNLIQQVFPFQAWGKRYLTAPTSNNSGASNFITNMYRIAVKDPTTKVKKNGVEFPTSELINNFYYEYASNTADYIEADKPIMVAQYLPSNGGCPFSSGFGDPAIIYISPIEQAVKRTGFYRNTRQAITTNYLTLIIPTGGLSSLTIDGSQTFDHTYDHPNLAGYKVVVKRWAAAQAQCIVKSDMPFTAVTYGLGSVESYAYNAGTLINNLNVIGNIHNSPDTTVTSHQYTCINTPANVGMYIGYKPAKLVWLLSQVPGISPNTDVTDNAPTPVDSMLQGGIWYYKYELPTTYTFSNAGEITIPVRVSHPTIDNCDNSEVVNFVIEVRPDPIANFTVSHTGCVLDTIQFSSLDTTSNGYNINSWTWTFPDGSTSTDQNLTKLFTTAGVQNVQLSVVTNQGCLGDTIKALTVYAPPTADFGTAPVSICAGSTVTFSDSSVYGGPTPITNWYWDFGNGNNTLLNNANNQTVTYPAPGTYTIKHLSKVNNVCVSDTVSQVITVYANPQLGFTYPVNCLPVDGVVQFNSTSTVSDGQVLNYSWNFGDPNATASNPNTSTDANPTHTYSTGTYTIQYKVTTANGCLKDTTITATFNVKPLLAYPERTSVCESVKGSISVAGASVTNNVPGNGVYSGPATTAAGQFTPSQAGAGVHTIWYKFTSNGGCTDSISTTIKVHPKPVAIFTVDNSICLNQTATVTDASTIPSGTITNWNWNFGDNTNASYTNGNPFTRSYNTHGNYTIKLVAISDSSCVSDTVSKTIAVNPLPVTNFNMPSSVCMPNGTGTFTNLTSVADNSGLSYVWNFGDGSPTSTATSPSHTFTSYGPFNITLTATSAKGCVKDSVKVFNAFYDKPIADFDVSPDTLCQGVDNVFTEFSTAPGSTVASWKWIFGDGTTSTQSDPVKKYTNPGNYNVRLIVTNAVGCVSDTFSKPVIVYLQPVIDAGPSFIVPEGTLIQFNPTANDSTVLNFLWTPSGDFADATVLRPQLLANRNQVYVLTATGQGNCSATDTISVKILKPVTVPNAFSPNGDGVNDTWIIKNLIDYPGATVEIFNRYGQQIFYSSGYTKPWDGTFKGSALPVATYYYVITLKNGFVPITGSVTIVK